MDKSFTNLLYCNYIYYMMNSQQNNDLVETLKTFIKNSAKEEVDSLDKETFKKNIISIEKYKFR